MVLVEICRTCSSRLEYALCPAKLTNKDDILLKANELLKLEKFEQALEVVDDYLVLHATDSSARSLGAKIQLALQQNALALDYFRIAFDGGLANEEALGTYSKVLFEHSEYQQSVQVLERLTGLFNERAIYFSNLGYVQHLSGNQAAAIEHCRRAIELDANCIEAYCNLGTALLSDESYEQALDAYERGIAINTRYAKLHTGLGTVHQKCGRFSRAIDAHQQAIMLDPSCIEAYCNLGIAQMQCLQADRAVENFQQALRLNSNYAAAVSNLQLTLQYLPGVPLSLLRTAVNYPATEIVSGQNDAKNTGLDAGTSKLRIGFVSADFYKHPVGYFLRGLFQIPRRSGYEFYCYANQVKSDSFTEALQKSADNWLDVRTLSDQKLAETLLADEIDILVDLSGHTAGNRLGVFAKRPAPVQVSWLGYFASTNTNFMDYMLLSKEQAPPGAEQYYSEKLIRLDCCQFAYFPPEEETEIREWKVSSDAATTATRANTVFGCFNNAAKINDELISIWSQILKAVPDSLLVLKWKCFEDKSVCENTAARFQRYGIEKRQLQLRGASSHQEMLAQYNDIDIALDTIPFSGALTSCEALWMGVPVVTMRQLRPVSRQTHAILKSVGLECLSSRTPAAYAETAIRLASDDVFLKKVSHGLRERLLESSSENQSLLSVELESFFREASD